MVQVEIVVQSVRDAVEAEEGGASRLELCCALDLGGLTPSAGLIREVRHATGLPLFAMIRCRPGGFHYEEAELRVMLEDAQAALAAGADGMVFGALDDAGRVHREHNARIIQAADGRPVVFHRAFDATPNADRALEDLIELRFTRVLTSGHAPTAEEGIPTLRRHLERAGSRIEVLPGGKIRAHNAAQIVAETGATQIHLAPLSSFPDGHQGIRREDVAAVVAKVRKG